MNVTPDPAPTTDAADNVDDSGSAVKPVRRRRVAVKPASVEAAAMGTESSMSSLDPESDIGSPGAVAPDFAAAAAADAAPARAESDDVAQAEPVAKPRRRRATSAVAALPVVVANAPSSSGSAPDRREPPDDGATPAASTPDAGPAAVELATAAGGSGSAVATAVPVDAETADVRVDAGADPVAAASEQPAVAQVDDDSPRGRRRNRRERNRNEGNQTAATDAGDADSSDASGAPAALPPVIPVSTEEVFAQVLSGEFDVTAAASADQPEAVVDEVAASKRVLQAEVDAPKLHKLLAQSGIGSRRDMESLIEEGQVTVNGEVAHVGQRVSFGDQVKVKGKPVRLRIVPPAPRIIAYHKPVGEIVTHDDPQNRPTVFRRLPRLQQGKWQSVGRLDINTEGLLLFTNSGELANQLMHPRFGVEREYAVRVLGICTPEHKARLLEGVEIDGQTASFRSVEDGGGDGANHWYRVVITEGRNREVRRLFDSVGLTVSRLIRIRYGTVVLPFGLKRGVWVDLGPGDVGAIRRLATPAPVQRPERGERPARGNNNTNSNHGGNDRAPARGGQQGPNGPRVERPNDRQAERQGSSRPNDRPRHSDNLQHNNGPRSRPGDNPSMPAAPATSFENGREVDRDPDADIDFDPMSIPNPLEQTFDKRFVQNPRSPAGGRGFRSGGGGFGAGGSAPDPVNKKGQLGPKQPDPMQTSLGFIGADAFHRKNRSGGNGGGGQGGAGGGQGGNGPRGNNNRGGPRGGGFGGGGSGGNGGGGNGGGFNGPGGGRRGR